MKKFVWGFIVFVVTIATFGASNAQAQRSRNFNRHFRMVLTSQSNETTLGSWDLQREFGQTAVYYGSWASKRCNNIVLQNNGFSAYYVTISGCNNGAYCNAQMYDNGFSLRGTLYCATGNVWNLELQ